MLNALLDPIFSPLLLLKPLFAVILISGIISLAITLVYRKFTDQDLMKDLKNQTKELQKEMKTLKDNPKKMMEVQKQAMETNTKYMMHSMKPTLFTFIPIIIIFSWLNANMAYLPIAAGEDFTSSMFFNPGVNGPVEIILPTGIQIIKGDIIQQIADSKVEWVMKGDKGEYVLKYKFNDILYEQKLIITSSIKERKYIQPELSKKNFPVLKDSGIDKIIINNKKIQPFQDFPILRSIPWIGNWGWLGTYILFSILFSIGIRKVLKVY